MHLLLLVGLFGCDGTNADWERAVQLDTVAGYREFLSLHPEGEHAQEAEKRLESLSWERVHREDSSDAYSRFLKEFPTGELRDNARVGLAWTMARQEKDAASIKQFLATYPQSLFSAEARQQLNELEEGSWEEVCRRHTVGGYEVFLTEFPGSKHTDAARLRIQKLHWEEAEIAGTLEGYMSFARRYPSSEEAAGAKERAEQLSWQAATQEAGIEQLAAHLVAFPNGRYTDDGKTLIEERLWQQASEAQTVAGYEEYVRACPQGLHASQAAASIERLSWIEACSVDTNEVYHAYLDRFPASERKALTEQQLQAIDWKVEVQENRVVELLGKSIRAVDVRVTRSGDMRLAELGPSSVRLGESAALGLLTSAIEPDISGTLRGHCHSTKLAWISESTESFDPVRRVWLWQPCTVDLFPGGAVRMPGSHFAIGGQLRFVKTHPRKSWGVDQAAEQWVEPGSPLEISLAACDRTRGKRPLLLVGREFEPAGENENTISWSARLEIPSSRSVRITLFFDATNDTAKAGGITLLGKFVPLAGG